MVHRAHGLELCWLYISSMRSKHVPLQVSVGAKHAGTWLPTTSGVSLELDGGDLRRLGRQADLLLLLLEAGAALLLPLGHGLAAKVLRLKARPDGCNLADAHACRGTWVLILLVIGCGQAALCMGCCPAWLQPGRQTWPCSCQLDAHHLDVI
jgi:hypothetical protein